MLKIIYIYSFRGNKLLTIEEEFTWIFLNLNLYTSITFIKSSFWIHYKQRYIRKLTFVRKSDFLGCVHLFTLYRINIVWTVTVRGGISHQTSCRRSRGWCTKLQSSLPNIYFRIGGLQAWLMFTLHRSMAKTYLICYNPISLASLRHKNRATTTVLVCEQKPCPVWFSWRRKNYLM